ncbi:MAG: tetratricopeptide repeat protein [Desulfatitalea sp.]|nr:tetratricopeptide repeat protein [Desulfatitalea sp.]
MLSYTPPHARLFFLLLACITTGCAGGGTSGQQPLLTHQQHDTTHAAALSVDTPRADQVALARKLIDLKHYDVALAQLDQTGKTGAPSAEIFYLAGVCYLAKGELNAAEKMFHASVNIDPGYAPAFNGLGRTAMAGNNTEDALAHFERAVALDPAKADICNNLGFALLQCGHPARAEPVLRRCLAINPDLAVARNNLAVCLGLQHKDQQALELLTETAPGDTARKNMEALRRFRSRETVTREQ